jgi:transcriptional/translational regulatory protein YebC/TACO1
MEIRSAVNKNHGKMAEQGSVLFMYDRRGKLEVDKVLDEEQLMDAAIEAGVDDFEIAEGEEESSCVVYVDPKDATSMSDAIQKLEGTSKFSLAYVSKAPVEVTDDEFEKNMKIYDALMDLDDVDQVEHNMSN